MQYLITCVDILAPSGPVEASFSKAGSPRVISVEEELWQKENRAEVHAEFKYYAVVP